MSHDFKSKRNAGGNQIKFIYYYRVIQSPVGTGEICSCSIIRPYDDQNLNWIVPEHRRLINGDICNWWREIMQLDIWTIQGSQQFNICICLWIGSASYRRISIWNADLVPDMPDTKMCIISLMFDVNHDNFYLSLHTDFAPCRHGWQLQYGRCTYVLINIFDQLQRKLDYPVFVSEKALMGLITEYIGYGEPENNDHLSLFMVNTCFS